MENLKMLFSFVTMIAAISAIGFACTQLPGSSRQIPENVVDIESGNYSNYPESGEIQKVITSEGEFAGEWQKVFSGTIPVPDTPDIDFENRRVILLMLESKPSGGFVITDLEVTEGESEVLVRYYENRPGDGCITTQALTKPYLIFSIPKADKRVRFHPKKPVINNCG